MQTNLQRSQRLFAQPVRYEVPDFQRRYVWKQDEQWEPLWDDVADTPPYRNGRTKPAVFKRGSSPRPAKQRRGMLRKPRRVSCGVRRFGRALGNRCLHRGRYAKRNDSGTAVRVPLSDCRRRVPANAVLESPVRVRPRLAVRHVIIFGHRHGLQRAIIDESQHRTPERLIMAQH